MAHAEPQAWWTEVEDVRERIERRRAGLTAVDGDGRDDLPGAGRFDRPADAPDAGEEPAASGGGRFVRPSLEPVPAYARRTVEIDGHGDRASDALVLAAFVSRDATVSQGAERAGRAALRVVDDPPARRVRPAAPRGSSRPRRVSGPATGTGIDIELHAVPEPRSRPPEPRSRPSIPSYRPALGPNPDRLAAWAFALAFLTLLVAAVSAHGL